MIYLLLFFHLPVLSGVFFSEMENVINIDVAYRKCSQACVRRRDPAYLSCVLVGVCKLTPPPNRRPEPQKRFVFLKALSEAC